MPRNLGVGGITATNRRIVGLPSILSATIPPGGDRLTLSWSCPVTAGSGTPTMTVDGNAATLTLVAHLGQTSTYTITSGNPAGNAVLYGSTCLLTAAAGVVLGPGGTGNAAVSGRAVTNRSEVSVPSLVTGMIANFKATALQVYTDAAKATRAVNNDLAYAMESFTAGSVDRVQATSTNRPQFKTGPARLLYDPSVTARYWNSLALGSITTLFSYHVFRTSNVGYHNVWEITTAGPNSWIDNAGRVECDAGVGNWLTGPVVTDGAWHTAFTYRQNSATSRLWVDGTEVIASPLVTSGSMSGAQTATLFNRGAAQTFKGDCIEFGFGTTLPSAALLTLLHTYLMGLTV